MKDYKVQYYPGMNDQDIVFSKNIKSGSRIYYLDVKKSHNETFYLAITESKKIEQADGTTRIKKHKVFLEEADIALFKESFDEAVQYIRDHQSQTSYECDIRKHYSHTFDRERKEIDGHHMKEKEDVKNFDFNFEI